MRLYFLPALTLLLGLTSADLPAQPHRLDIEITGIDTAVGDVIKEGLSLYLQKDHPLLSDFVIKRLHQKAPQEIRRDLQPFGYYRAQIEAALEPTEAGWRARYHIAPGPPLTIRRIELRLTGPGSEDSALLKWQRQYPLHEGGVLLQKDYETAKQALVHLAKERGFMDAALVTHAIRIDLTQYHADIHMDFDTGPRYRIGAIIYEQEGFDERFLRRYLGFASGDPYDINKLLSLRRAYADSDYFDRVDVEPLPADPSTHTIDLVIRLIPRKRTRYSAGIGYSTDTGPRGMLGFEKRQANEWGHRYGATLRQSGIRSSFLTRYQVPLSRPLSDNLNYSIGWVDEDTDTTKRTTTTVGADLVKKVGSWLRSTGISHETERYRLGNEADSRLLIPHVRMQRVSADQRIHTRRGWMLNLELRGASDGIFSTTSFAQVRGDAKLIFGVTDHTRVLLRGSGGGSWTPEFIELPASQRFLTGGDQSIRGYSYNTLGPKDATGRVIGGKHLMVGSGEYEIDLTDTFSAALFYDTGNAFNQRDVDFKVGAGFGLRWQLPIGAIRLDLASALREPGNPWRLHLTLGPDL